MTAETPPTRAIEEALKWADASSNWTPKLVLGDPTHAWHRSILAHAATLAKYEQPPVDRKVLCAEEALLRVTGGKNLNRRRCVVAIELYEEGFGQ